MPPPHFLILMNSRGLLIAFITKTQGWKLASRDREWVGSCSGQGRKSVSMVARCSSGGQRLRRRELHSAEEGRRQAASHLEGTAGFLAALKLGATLLLLV
ncbi:hypothetical protein H1C71_029372 [Ictidomys tridecemlineatus]|nr:hypothetical protein H1C71_029372 [Ictidomys tridecemlineatus]